LKSYFVEVGGQSYEVQLAPREAGATGYQVSVIEGPAKTRLVAEPFVGGALVAGGVYHSEHSALGVRVRSQTSSWLASVRDRRVLPKVAATRSGTARQSVERAPIPGQVTALAVVAGDEVEAGQELLTLEAMKMQNPVVAARAGKVLKVLVAVGDAVQADDPLVELSHTDG
jgi:biotin carboxyl carrier protein